MIGYRVPWSGIGSLTSIELVPRRARSVFEQLRKLAYAKGFSRLQFWYDKQFFRMRYRSGRKRCTVSRLKWRAPVAAVKGSANAKVRCNMPDSSAAKHFYKERASIERSHIYQKGNNNKLDGNVVGSPHKCHILFNTIPLLYINFRKLLPDTDFL